MGKRGKRCPEHPGHKLSRHIGDGWFRCTHTGTPVDERRKSKPGDGNGKCLHTTR